MNNKLGRRAAARILTQGDIYELRKELDRIGDKLDLHVRQDQSLVQYAVDAQTVGYAWCIDDKTAELVFNSLVASGRVLGVVRYSRPSAGGGIVQSWSKS